MEGSQTHLPTFWRVPRKKSRFQHLDPPKVMPTKQAHVTAQTPQRCGDALHIRVRVTRTVNIYRVLVQYAWNGCSRRDHVQLSVCTSVHTLRLAMDKSRSRAMFPGAPFPPSIAWPRCGYSAAVRRFQQRRGSPGMAMAMAKAKAMQNIVPQHDGCFRLIPPLFSPRRWRSTRTVPLRAAQCTCPPNVTSSPSLVPATPAAPLHHPPTAPTVVPSPGLSGPALAIVPSSGSCMSTCSTP
jgi:hypothetical protein